VNDADEQLGPCPKCRKSEGKIHDAGSGKFRYFVMCEACAWSTEASRIKRAAVKLWNEAETGMSETRQWLQPISSYANRPMLHLVPIEGWVVKAACGRWVNLRFAKPDAKRKCRVCERRA